MCSGIDEFVRHFCCVARLRLVPVFVLDIFCTVFPDILNPGQVVLSLLRGPDFVVVWFDGLWQVFVPLPF
jgi:hypothetical protein